MASRLKSIITSDLDHCIICGQPAERHHVFGGPNRHISTKDGMIVPLCVEHHRKGPNAVHVNADMLNVFHIIGQQAWENANKQPFEDVESVRERFRRRYGKSYL